MPLWFHWAWTSLDRPRVPSLGPGSSDSLGQVGAPNPKPYAMFGHLVVVSRMIGHMWATVDTWKILHDVYLNLR